MLDPELTSCFY